MMCRSRARRTAWLRRVDASLRRMLRMCVRTVLTEMNIVAVIQLPARPEDAALDGDDRPRVGSVEGVPPQGAAARGSEQGGGRPQADVPARVVVGPVQESHPLLHGSPREVGAYGLGHDLLA